MNRLQHKRVVMAEGFSSDPEEDLAEFVDMNPKKRRSLGMPCECFVIRETADSDTENPTAMEPCQRCEARGYRVRFMSMRQV